MKFDDFLGHYQPAHVPLNWRLSQMRADLDVEIVETRRLPRDIDQHTLEIIHGVPLARCILTVARDVGAAFISLKAESFPLAVRVGYIAIRTLVPRPWNPVDGAPVFGEAAQIFAYMGNEAGRDVTLAAAVYPELIQDWIAEKELDDLDRIESDELERIVLAKEI